MINISELRIGNYVTSTIGKWGSKPREITGIKRDELYFFDVFEFSVPIELIKPVRITDELLFDFGFKRIKDDFQDNYIIPDRNFSIKKHDNGGDWYVSNDESDAGCYVVCIVKYVHDLQNAFYDLKRKELTLKN